MDYQNQGAYGYFGGTPWEQLSPEQRLQWAKSQPGSGIALTEMANEQSLHPERNSPNYWDSVMGAIANNSAHLKPANVPETTSGIGMMSGDATQDIATGYGDTIHNYGPDPRQEYIPRGMTAASNDPNASPEAKAAAEAVQAKQKSRTQEWLGHLGEGVGQAAGIVDSYNPQYNEEGRPVGETAEIQGYDPLTGMSPAQRIAHRRRMGY